MTEPTALNPHPAQAWTIHRDARGRGYEISGTDHAGNPREICRINSARTGARRGCAVQFREHPEDAANAELLARTPLLAGACRLLVHALADWEHTQAPTILEALAAGRQALGAAMLTVAGTPTASRATAALSRPPRSPASAAPLPPLTTKGEYAQACADRRKAISPEVLQASLTDPIVHAAMQGYLAGRWTYTAALEAACSSLAWSRASILRAMTRRAAEAPPGPPPAGLKPDREQHTEAAAPPAFNPADCGGTFDGRQATSDADPGL